VNLPHRKAVPASQYGAALDMLEHAVRACPDARWADRSVPVSQQFWYLTFHTLWWHDYYMEVNERDHVPPPPYSRERAATGRGLAGRGPAARRTVLRSLEQSSFTELREERGDEIRRGFDSQLR